MFRHEAAWQTATIHHFSLRLFARGRRFIADSEESADYPIGPAGGESTLLETITRMGRLTHIRICELHSLFGQSRDLWLRPVLIDGRNGFCFMEADLVSSRRIIRRRLNRCGKRAERDRRRGIILIHRDERLNGRIIQIQQCLKLPGIV